jgi:hypothetical protein
MPPVIGRFLPVLLTAFLLSPPLARAGPMPWDQERAAAIAGELALAVERVKRSLERDPEQPSVMQEKQRRGLIVDVRRLSALSAELAARLKAGEGLEETRPVYESIQRFRREAREAGRDVLNPASTARDIVAARGLLQRLAAYYEGG